MNFFPNSSPYHDNWYQRYQSGRSVACDSYFHPSTPHLYLAQPPSQAPPSLSMADPNHHQPLGPSWFSGQFQYHGHSPLPPPPNHNQQQAFLGDFRPWEREYDPPVVISSSSPSIQHSHLQIDCSLSTVLPPTFVSMATPSIPVSSYTWPAHTYFVSPTNQPNTNNKHEVFDERSEWKPMFSKDFEVFAVHSESISSSVKGMDGLKDQNGKHIVSSTVLKADDCCKDTNDCHQFMEAVPQLVMKVKDVEAAEVLLINEDSIMSAGKDPVYNNSVNEGYQESTREATAVEEATKIDFVGNLCMCSAYHDLGQLPLTGEKGMEITCSNSGDVKAIRTHATFIGETSSPIIFEETNIEKTGIMCSSSARLSAIVSDYSLHCQTPLKGNDESTVMSLDETSRKGGEKEEPQKVVEAQENDDAYLFEVNTEEEVFSPGSVESEQENLRKILFVTPDTKSTSLSEQQTSTQATEILAVSMSSENNLKTSILGRLSHGKSLEVVELREMEVNERSELKSKGEEIAGKGSNNINKEIASPDPLGFIKVKLEDGNDDIEGIGVESVKCDTSKNVGVFENVKPVNDEKYHSAPDEVVTKCTSCGADFSVFVRKHYYKNCGEILCDKCTQGRIALTGEDNAPRVRVCDRCITEATHRLSNAKEKASISAISCSGLVFYGIQKGAVLSYGNLITNIADASVRLIWNPLDVYIPYLPLAHYGTAVGIYQGNHLKLMDDVATTRPTHYHVLLNKVGLSAYDLQDLVHSLSHVYQRSPTANFIVAPICYGDGNLVIIANDWRNTSLTIYLRAYYRDTSGFSFSYGWYFTFVQGFVCLILLYLQEVTIKQMVNPWKTYVKHSAVFMGSHRLTKGSLAFINYPTQIMFKSTKVLHVFVVGAFIFDCRKKYSPHAYFSAPLLVVGLILFILADANTFPNFSVVDVVMVLGAIVVVAFLGNLQEATFTMNSETTQMEMLLYSTVVGLPFLILPMILTRGEYTMLSKLLKKVRLNLGYNTTPLVFDPGGLETQL